VRRKRRWVLLLVVACWAVLFSGILFTRDGHLGLPACEGGKPVGSEPCTYPCVSLGSPTAPPDTNCLYDPAGKNTATPTTYTQYPPPPTTAPGSSSRAVPPPAAN
jgi:hypothetical protein